MPHYEPYKYPDNPYRVAPPDQAPGESEPREFNSAEIGEMEFDVEREVRECLKNGTNFMLYQETGHVVQVSFYDLCHFLLDRLDDYHLAETMAAFMELGHGADGMKYAFAVRDTVFREAITPFVEEQAQRRLDAAIEQEAHDARESWREE